jgi:hypothetical protein
MCFDHTHNHNDILGSERLLTAPLLSKPELLKIFSFHLLFLLVKLITNIIFFPDISKYFNKKKSLKLISDFIYDLIKIIV